MIDIIPAAALASAAAYIKRESQPDENQESLGGMEKPPQPEDLDSKKPPRKKRRSALFIIAILILILLFIITMGLIFFDYSTFQKYFSPSTVSFDEGVSDTFKHLDEDSDGLSTIEEMAQGTLVMDPDTDKDSLPDGFEVKNGLNPLDYADGKADPDDDSLSNADEYAYKTDINDPDSDNDGYQDGEEVKKGFNPSGEGVLKNKVKRTKEAN